ncbi:hypothetical protein GO755_33475 [Spirosoma sp. HMF4905]|uniref:Uncharacterized protein n=1 Tax=Spirosoma arboris TaxID=2682092 RepID=A0A7K1SMH0_9BACT|nr:hypothetical protein [Spirosoma arboris]MVM34987.1 hypothetical protein [Spirosoma arboris]
MAYIAPKVGEMIYALKDRVGVYLAPSINASPTHTNDQNGNHALRDYRKGEAIGKVADDQIYPSTEGPQFLKVLNFVWVTVGGGLFGGGVDIPEFHEAYINIDDEGIGWVRDTYREGATQVAQEEDKRQEIETALKSFPGIPTPTIVKQTNAKGEDSWLLTFPNGYATEWEQFLALTPESKKTLTTSTVPKTGLTDGTGTTPATSTKSTVFTTTNILIGVGILTLFAGLLVVLLRKKK